MLFDKTVMHGQFEFLFALFHLFVENEGDKSYVAVFSNIIIQIYGEEETVL